MTQVTTGKAKPLPVFDRRVASETDSVSTTSPAFVDIPGMSLTTINSQALIYIITFKGNFSTNVKNRKLETRIVVDGTPVTSSTTRGKPGAANDSLVISTQHLASISNGKVIKVQYKCIDANTTVTATERNLIIDGKL